MVRGVFVLSIVWFGLVTAAVVQATPRIAVIGDSMSTGAMSHRSIIFDQKRMLEILSGEQSIAAEATDADWLRQQGLDVTYPFLPPVILPNSPHEIDASLGWFMKLVGQQAAQRFVNTEELGWPYLLAASMNIPPQNLWLAAHNGARVRSAIHQIDRILDYGSGLLPDHVFLFFAGNDLCSSAVNLVTDQEQYGDQLAAALAYLAKNGRPGGRSTKVWVVDPLVVLQLVQSDKILNKIVTAHGESMTCKKLHDRVHQVQPMPLGDGKGQSSSLLAGLVQYIPQSPVAFCSNLFGGGDRLQQKERRVQLGNTLRGYRQAIKEQVAVMQERNLSGFQWNHIEETRNVIFEADEMASDCYHLSIKGHLRLARLMAEAIGK